jgi:transcriptional regulator with XRE-family HTH domain
MNKNEKNFGAFLRQIRLTEVRENVKTSLRKLAEEAEIDPAYLSRIERGEIQRPGRETIEKIAAALCRMKELQKAECEELNRRLLRKAKYKLTIDELGLKPVTIEDLFAQRLRDRGVAEPFVLEAKDNVPVHQMSKVLSGEDPIPLRIKNIDDEELDASYIEELYKQIRDAPQRSQRVEERKFRAGARAFIQVDGELTTSQEEQIRALTALLRSILKINK